MHWALEKNTTIRYGESTSIFVPTSQSYALIYSSTFPSKPWATPWTQEASYDHYSYLVSSPDFHPSLTKFLINKNELSRYSSLSEKWNQSFRNNAKTLLFNLKSPSPLIIQWILAMKSWHTTKKEYIKRAGPHNITSIDGKQAFIWEKCNSGPALYFPAPTIHTWQGFRTCNEAYILHFTSSRVCHDIPGRVPAPFRPTYQTSISPPGERQTALRSYSA